MASSFITKDEINGFWVRDELLQVICWAFVTVIDQMPTTDKNAWLRKEYRNYLYDCSQGLFVGFTTLRMGEFITSEERRMLFNTIIISAEQYFISKGETIPIEELNEFQLIRETRSRWIAPLATSRMLRLLKYIADVVNDVCTIKVDDNVIDF